MKREENVDEFNRVLINQRSVQTRHAHAQFTSDAQ